MWLWTNRTGLSASLVDRCWQAFLRRFDIEHTFRFLKQALGWTTPHLRDPAAADTWTWLILAAYAQLWLARPLTKDLRRPWEKPAQPGRLTQPGSAAGFATSARRPPVPPAHQNPPGRTRRPKGSKNKSQHPATTQEKPPNATSASSSAANAKVKRQAQSLLIKAGPG